MFHQFYATTKDKKGHEHNYKLQKGEGVPNGHEITNLAVAGRWKFEEILDPEMVSALKDHYKVPGKKGRRAKA